MRTPPEHTHTGLPVWAQIGDGLTLLLAVAALRVALLGMGLPLGLVAIEAIFARVHDDAGKVVHAQLVTVPGTMTLLPVLKRLGGMDAVP